MAASYEEQQLEGGDSRVVLHLPPVLAPNKVAVLPLVKKDGLPQKAAEVMNMLKFDFKTVYDEKDSIGKRYRRQDAVGTPFCVTIDHQTLEDDTVTIRHRDSMGQSRVPVDSLHGIVNDNVSLRSIFSKIIEN